MKTRRIKSVFQKFLLMGVFLFIVFGLSATNAPITSIGSICNAVPGQQLTIPINITGFSNIGSFYLNLEYDYTKIQFISGQQNAALPGDYSMNDVDRGNGIHRIVMSWSGGISGISLPDGSAIVNLVFKYISGSASLTWYTVGPYCKYTDKNVIALTDLPKTDFYLNGTVSSSCGSAPTIEANGPTSFCEGGSVTLTSSPGVSYLWSNGEVTKSIIASTSGSYTVEVTDGTGSKATSTAISVTVVPKPLTPTINLIQPTCSAATGSISVSSDKSGLSFSIDGSNYSNTSGIFSGLLPGDYFVTAKNAAGCVSAQSAKLTINAQPLAPSAPTAEVTQPTCSAATGSISVSSDKSGLSFSIDGSNYSNTSGIFSGLLPGDYFVTAKNAAGCVSAQSTKLTINAQPLAPLAPTAEVTQPTCSVATGSISVSSDKSGLSFSIDGSNYSNTSGIFSGLLPGDYFVTAKNAAGCISQATSVTIIENPTSPGQWLGLTSDWDTESNWCGGVPTSTTDVIIPSGVTQPIIGVSTSASCHDINIEGGATLTIASDVNGTGSLIVSGTVSGAGSAFVKRYMTTDAWHVVTSPVSGQGISSFLNSNPNVAEDALNADIRGMMDYNADLNAWNDYFKNSQSGNLEAGKGFSIRTNTDSPVTFTGKLNAGPVTVGALLSDRWNCIGNPYTSAIGINEYSSSVANFLKVNAIDNSNLDPSYSAIYIWDNGDENNGEKGKYTIIANTPVDGAYHIQQGQAFMVLMNDAASSVSYTSSMQTHLPGLGLKSTESAWPTIKLEATVNGQTSSTILSFNNRMTKGLDVTYDAGLLRGGSDLIIYSKLVQDNGIPFAIQALPANEFDRMIIPLGVESKTAGGLTFSSEMFNLPSGCQVILEDKQNKTFTDLSQKDYSTTISANSVISDRFQIHTSNLTTGLKEINLADKLTAYAIRNVEIRIKGQVSNQAIATLYDIQGRVIVVKNLEEGSLNTIQTPNLKTAIYLLIVNDNGKLQNIKIPVKE
ncbi:MAG: T9SS type A sorting domain-containing protein [Prolixibacteraceae bacterium]|nr:T9SS type A sorting domain-containing protein [Prolixibacteraceae bacterium]